MTLAILLYFTSNPFLIDVVTDAVVDAHLDHGELSVVVVDTLYVEAMVWPSNRVEELFSALPQY